MAKRQVSVLIGCKEFVVAESVKAVLAHHHQASTAFHFVASSGFDDFIRDVSTGHHAIAIMAPNCFLSPQPDMLEHSLRAVQTVKATCSVPLVILTPMKEWLVPLRSAGADVCLQTPFTAKELVGAISSFV